MTLNSVDLPQPDGPITDRNSPGRTSNDTSSTAITGPSAVSKRTLMSVRRQDGVSAAGTAMRQSPLRVMAAVVAAV